MKKFDNVKQLVVDFSKETTAHAIRQALDGSRPTFARIFWGFMLFGTATLFVYQTTYLIIIYLMYPTSVSMSLKFGPLSFPTIIFCNNNPLKKSLLSGTDVEGYLDIYKELLSSNNSFIIEKYCPDKHGIGGGTLNTTTNKGTRLAYGGFCENFYELRQDDGDIRFDRAMYMKLQIKAWNDIPMLINVNQSAYNRARYTLNDMLVSCVYNMNACKKNDFYTTNHAYFGSCHTFKASSAINVTRSGALYGLRMLIHVASNEYLPTIDNYGIKVAVHDQDTIPLLHVKAYSVSSGFRTSMGVSMVRAEKLSEPYGKCRKEKGHVELCMQECYMQHAATICNCTMFENEENERSCRTAREVVCYSHFNDIMSINYTLNVDICNCSQSCTTTTFHASVTQSVFQIPAFTNFIDQETDMSKDILELEVFYEELNYKIYEEQSSYPLVNLFSDFGGSVGLWLGASVCTLAEFVTLGLSICFVFCNFTKRHKKDEK